MFLLDDILLAPMGGVLWLCREIHSVAQKEISGQAERITAELGTLYSLLESGQITEADFEEQEQVLLDRLDAIAEAAEAARNEEADEDDSEEDWEELPEDDADLEPMELPEQEDTRRAA